MFSQYKGFTLVYGKAKMTMHEKTQNDRGVCKGLLLLWAKFKKLFCTIFSGIKSGIEGVEVFGV